MFINRRMDKSVVAYSYKAILPAMRMNKQLLHSATWANLINIRLRKRNQTQKGTYWMIQFV